MLDELIRHCEEVAEKNEKFCDKKRGEDTDKYRQLAEWLKDYKRLVDRKPCEDAISRKEATEIFKRWLACPDYNETERNIMRAAKTMLDDLSPMYLKCLD